MERIWECENEMTKGQIKLGTIEKRLEFLEMQVAENISNIDKIYKGLERLDNQDEVKKFLTKKFEELEKKMNMLVPKGIIDPVDENDIGYRT